MVVAYVCSVRDFAGKNVISLGLGRKMQEDGLNLAFMKPYGVRPLKIEDEITDADAWLTSQFLGLEQTPKQCCPVVRTQDLLAKTFRGDSAFFTWLYRIAVNLSLNALRKRRMRQLLSFETVGMTIASRDPQPDRQLEKQEILEKISDAINKLPNKQKMVFTLRYHQGLPHSEIARIMGRDEGTIRANYHQAIRKLQKAVKS